ncbi:MAG: Tetratricopeptide 2 repeat protein [Myxococcales bacterium]|nr:Tetratricopeptide 2 repeat protein [Myxococcales bacterium]
MSKNVRSILNPFSPLAIVLTISCVLPACEGFVCSQERIKAIEYANKGADEFKNNLYDSAEKDLKQAMATDPTYEIAYYNLGKVYQKQRKWDKAAEQFEAAVSRAPNNANYQYDLGEAYLEAKKVDQAEKALKAATVADPKLFKSWWRLGLVYKMLDRPKEADEALRHAIEDNTRFSKSYVALGYLYLDYDFNKEAAQVFQGCVTAKEDDGECHNGYGLALKNLKQFEQATSEFKKAIDLDPELYDALYNAGMAYSDWYDEAHGNDQKDKARDYLQKFVTNSGKSSDPNYVKAANDKLYALSGA